jgi:hypothetical protein
LTVASVVVSTRVRSWAVGSQSQITPFARSNSGSENQFGVVATSFRATSAPSRPSSTSRHGGGPVAFGS